MKFQINVIFLFILATLTVAGNPTNRFNDSLIANIVLKEGVCNSCCIASLNILSKEFIDFGITKQIVFIDKRLSNIKPLLKQKCKAIDSVIIVDRTEIDKLFPNAVSEGIFIQDKNKNNYFHFTNLRNVGLCQQVLRNYNSFKEHIIQFPEYSFNILPPFISDDNKNIFLIDPNNSLVFNYSLVLDSIINFYEPDKETMFTYFNPEVHSKDIWEMTFEGAPSFIHFYFVYQDTTKVNSYITILNDYNFDSTKKNVRWSSIPSKLSLNEYSIVSKFKESDDQYYPKSGFTRYYTKLNDSLLLIPSYTSYSNSGFAILNIYNDSVNYYASERYFNNYILNGDSILFSSNNFNKIIMLNHQNMKLDIYEYKNSQFKKVSKDYSHINSNDDYELYDIMSFDRKLLVLYFNKLDLLYVEEYSLDDLTFQNSYTLLNNTNYLNNINFIKYDGKNLFMSSANEEGTYLIQNFIINK